MIALRHKNCYVNPSSDMKGKLSIPREIFNEYSLPRACSPVD